MNHVLLQAEMREVKAAGNSRTAVSSANLFHSPADVRHEIDSLQDISF